MLLTTHKLMTLKITHTFFQDIRNVVFANKVKILNLCKSCEGIAKYAE